MIGPLFSGIAAANGLTVASGMAYGMLNGCFVTLSEEPGVQRISIYVGGQEQPLPGYAESQTVSCAKQILHTISSASGPENHYSLMTGSEQIPALILNHAGSVVTVNFPDAPEARGGVERFIAELLPQAAPLTRPMQCIFCCAPTNGDAVPVRLSSDTVAPMHLPCHQRAAALHAPTREEKAAQRKAILGAAGGALIGGILWALLCGLSPFAWIVGVLMGLLPVLCYDWLRGKPGTPRYVTVIVCAVSAALLGSLAACVGDSLRVYAANRSLTDALSIGPWSFLLANLTRGAGIKALTYGLAGLLTAAVGALALLRQTASATAEAAKPRRLKGQF